VAFEFDLVQCSQPAIDALQERFAFGTQSPECGNFDHSRLVDARGAQKQFPCGLSWHGGSALIEREPDRSLSHRRSVVMPMMGLTSHARQLFRKVVDKRKPNVSHARQSFANISRTLKKQAIVKIETSH
jgi:hypothetical protein